MSSVGSEFRYFRSDAGAHIFVTDGSRIYDIDEQTARDLDADGAAIGVLMAGLGIDRGEDRYIGSEAITPPMLHALSLTVSQACNMGCGYCYADEGKFGGAARMMSLETAKSGIDRLVAASAPGSDIVLGFMGGEPLLNRAVVHGATRYAAQAATQADRRIRFSLTTNATLLQETDAELFAAYPFSVAISIDGDRATHDRNRTMHGGGGSYARVVAGLDVLRRVGGPRHLSARVTVTPKSGSLAASLDHLIGLGFDSVGFAAVLTSPNPALAFAQADFEHFLEEMIVCGRTAHEHMMAGKPYPFSNFETALQEIHRGAHRPFPCGAGAGYLSASADGGLYACHRLVDAPEFAMGDVQEGADRRRQAEHLRRSHVDQMAPCNTCWARYLCGGGCYHEVARRGRIGCDYIRGWLAFCLARYAELSVARPAYFGAQGTKALLFFKKELLALLSIITPRGSNMSENRITGQPRIFPRNLTARASTMVLGNPANARPESGVDNCHPGLEFDQRNIDQVFFPGLRFEFQFLLGAKLVDIDKALSPDLQETDVQQDLYLWYLHGCFGAAPGTPQLVNLVGLDGYEALRRVRDLEPGALTVVIGQTPDVTNAAQVAAWGDRGMKLARDIIAATSPGGPPPTPRIVRDGTGVLLAAAVAGNRAAYLDGGVISLGAIKAGDLTRSLCAPWQWDFADCGCHYWASNKPDLVMGAEEGASQTLNFQRKRQLNAEPAKASDAKMGLYDRWTDVSKTISQPEMVTAWQSLPVVIGERETSRTDPAAPLTQSNHLSPKEVAEELTILATIEHALCVEYLYAHYSIAAPERRPAAGDTRLFDAAHQILTIAIDEMRHFQWANEALILLGAPVALGRATTYGQEGKNQFQGSFKPGPLTAERLNGFIDIEAPSKTFGNGRTLDGYYTHILTSVAGWEEAMAPADRRALMAVIKLIIDEGHEHFQRFTDIKNLLSGLKEEAYLQIRDDRPAPQTADDPAETPEEAAKKMEDDALRDLGDNYYHTLLAVLRLAFTAGEDARNGLLKQARRSMHNLHEVGQKLAVRGIGLPFSLPPDPDIVARQAEKAYPAALLNRIDDLRMQSDALLGSLATSPDHAIKTLARKQRKSLHASLASPAMTPVHHP